MVNEDKHALKKEKRLGGKLLEIKQTSLISDSTPVFRADLHSVM